MNPACDYIVVVNSDPARPKGKLMQCAASKKILYCSQACQKAHWEEHKPKCNKIRKSANIPLIEEQQERQDELRRAFEGDHAPVAERLIWRSLSDNNPATQAAKMFVKKLDIEHVSQYASEKFIKTRHKGAVLFNIKYPVPHVVGSGRFIWLPYGVILKTKDQRLLKIVEEYDPERVSVMIYALPSADGLSCDIWPVTTRLQLGSTHYELFQPLIQEAKEDWEDVLEEYKK